jgi:hypothetical protein
MTVAQQVCGFPQGQSQAAASHRDAFWKEEFPLMVAWAFGR